MKENVLLLVLPTYGGMGLSSLPVPLALIIISVECRPEDAEFKCFLKSYHNVLVNPNLLPVTFSNLILINNTRFKNLT